MASKRKQGTLGKIGQSVSDAAKTAMTAAEDYVVEPVSNLLGLSSKKTTKKPAVKKTRVVALKRTRAGTAPKTGSRVAQRAAPAKRPATAKRK